MRKLLLALLLAAAGLLFLEKREVGEVRKAVAVLTHPLRKVEGKILQIDDMVKGVGLGVGFARIESGVWVDRYYFAPSPNQVEKLIKHAANGLEYVPEVYDCDDYSYYFKGYLQREWRKAGHYAPLPIAQVFAKIYIPKTDEYVLHAFNGIVDSTGHIHWIEPQGPFLMRQDKFVFIDVYALWI